jgi:KaiC/GvpD/RAD55 family RecA-like ATPase
MVSSGTNPSYHWLLTLIAAVPWIMLAVITLGYIFVCLLVTLRWQRRRQLLRGTFVLLELTPPLHSEKTPLATSRLLGVLHELASPHSAVDRLLRRRAALSLEVVSSRSSGIRYMLYASEKDAANIKRDIVAYLPGVRCKKIKNYMDALPKNSTVQAVEFRQQGHPSLPLHAQDSLSQHDPIAYMTGAMTQLKPEELIVFQLLMSPITGWRSRRGSDKALRSSNHGFSLVHSLSYILRLGTTIIMRLIRLVRVMVLDIPEHGRRVTIASHPSENPVITEVRVATQDKLSQPLFRTNIRALIVAKDTPHVAERMRAMESSLASFDVTGYQSLRAKRGWLHALMSRSYLANVQKRLPSILPRSRNVLSASEVADIYHFPYGTTTQTENLVTSLSRSLPAPISLKGKTKFDVLLGTNVHHGSKTPIGLTAAERERHVYIVGGTGNGKTTMLLYAIEQDIRHGKGVAIIDPHGDLAESILKYIPKKRLDDVIYFNPDDVVYPIGLNLLEIPTGLSGDELVREKDLVTETVISVFRKIFSEDDSGGHRIEYVLRNTIQTALTIEDATIFTIFRLLTNGKYRKQVVANLEDQDLKDFWNNEMGKAGEFQRIKMSAGITAKVGRFLFSGSAKRILGQPKSTIDFDDIINSGKILVCNFSKGLLGEDTASLFGITVLAKLQIATLRRARLQPGQRRPFYLYVDEFQNFATMSFVQLMSEARKYKLFLNMAEQSTSQQAEQRIVNIILANVGTVICFRSANQADEQSLLPVFAPFIEPSEIAYLPPFHFYVRIAAAKSEAPFSGETVVLHSPGMQTRVQQVIESSRSRYSLEHDSSTLERKPLFDIDDYEIDAPVVLS